MANTAMAIRGLEEMYRDECSNIEEAIGKTILEITSLQNNLADRLTASFNQKAGFEWISGDATDAASGFRIAAATSILSASLNIAVEMERVIEKSIEEEIKRLMPFVISVDRIFQHFALVSSSVSMIKHSADKASTTERAPLLERLRAFRSTYSIGDAVGIEDSQTPARSIYSAGVITALLETYALYEMVAKSDESMALTSGDALEIKNTLPHELSEQTCRAIHERSFARIQNLGIFIRIRFAELQSEIEAGFAEIRSLCITEKKP